MATPRYKLVDSENALSYHLVSRCVRGAWLCGKDRRTGKDYSHRKRWLIERLLFLAQFFAVEVDSYSVMSNHFHLVAFFDPQRCWSWTNEEVAFRWVEAFPPTEDGQVVEERKPIERERLLGDPKRLEQARRTLGSLSDFMKHLKQPIARRANKEDGCKGHFFEQRFYSGALLSEKAVLAAMAYVDLNPVRAKLAKRLAECTDASIGERLRENDSAALEEFLAPVASGLSEGKTTTPRIQMTLKKYVELLNGLLEADVAGSGRAGRSPDSTTRWMARVASIRKRQRAFGPVKSLKSWIADRGLQLREAPLPN